MKICASCGASLPDEAAFCVSCGSKEFLQENFAEKQQLYAEQYVNRYQDQNPQQYEYTEQYQYENPQQYGYAEQYQDENTQQYEYAEQYQDENTQQYEYAEQYQDENTQQYESAEQYQPAEPPAETNPEPEKDNDNGVKIDTQNYHEDSKNFKFEKKSDNSDDNTENDKKPKSAKKFIAQLMDTKDFTADFNNEDINQNKVTSIIACFGITFWVPFVFSGNSRFSRFYANQGLLVLIVSLIFTIPYALFSSIVNTACTVYSFNASSPSLSPLGYILDILLFAICYAIPIFMIITAIMNIRSGKAKNVPFVGKYRLIR